MTHPENAKAPSPLPCPFCGVIPYWHSQTMTLACQNAACIFRPSIQVHSRIAAVESWNRRQGSSRTTDAWQKCPICDGRGMVTWDPQMPTHSISASAGPWTCPTCNGLRVISPASVSQHPAEEPEVENPWACLKRCGECEPCLRLAAFRYRLETAASPKGSSPEPRPAQEKP